MTLAELLKLLRDHGVKRFKDADYDLEFSAEPLAAAAVDPVKPPEKPAEPVYPPGMPDDLKGTMTMEQIMNWSGSPDHAPNEAIQGTGDAPIEPPPIGLEP